MLGEQTIEEGVYAVQFFDVLVLETKFAGATHELKSEFFNPSPLIYIKGKVLTLPDMEREYPEAQAAIENMKRTETFKVIKHGTNFYPLFTGSVNATEREWDQAKEIAY